MFKERQRLGSDLEGIEMTLKHDWLPHHPACGFPMSRPASPDALLECKQAQRAGACRELPY